MQFWSHHQGFIPTLAIGPLVWMWRIADNDLRRMQVRLHWLYSCLIYDSGFSLMSPCLKGPQNQKWVFSLTLSTISSVWSMPNFRMLSLTYHSLSIFAALLYSLRHGHYLILVSSLICVINVFLHPIAGSFFLVKPGVTMVPCALRPSLQCYRSILVSWPSSTSITSH